MRQKTLYCLLLLAMAGIGITGCKHDVNLKDITVDSNVNVRLNNLPIGEISATFADIIGLVASDSTVSITNDEDGVLVLRIDEHYDREFHKIELKDYIGEIHTTSKLHDVDAELDAGIPANKEATIPFKLDITFNGVNNNLSNERLDSMVIEKAEFTTRISSSNLAIEDKDIKRVVMRLGDQFRRAEKDIELENFHLDTDISIKLDNFTLVMMADASQDPDDSNVVNTADITFIITLQSDKYVAVAANSGFTFDFQVEFMDYSALYGFFEASSQTRDKSYVGNPLKFSSEDTVLLPVKEPKIELLFTYGVSMPLNVRINHIKAIRPDKSEVYAEWGGSTSTLKSLSTVLPADTALDAIAKDSSIMLNHETQNGDIDRFFADQVDSMGYDYKLEVDRGRKVRGKEMKQFRLTQNTNFALDFRFTMPFKFNTDPGLKIVHTETISDISLERASLDSLAALSGDLIKQIDKESELDLYLTFTNNIPVGLMVDAQFLDEKGNEFENLSQLRNIAIESASKSGSVITPSRKTESMHIKASDFDDVANTKNIRLKIRVSDDKQQGATFLVDQKLSIKVGLTGDVKALMHLNLTSDNTKK